MHLAMTFERNPDPQGLLAQVDWITRLSRALVRDADAALDLGQDAVVDVLRSPWQEALDPRRFVAAIVRRRAGKHRRTDVRRARREEAAARPEAVPSAAELAARLEMHRELTEAVQSLDEPYRTAIVLRWFEQLDVDAIAERTGSKRNTVRSHLQRGLEQLRERLDRRGGRERWMPLVAVLAQRPLAVEAAAGSVVAGIAASAIVKKTLVACAAVLAAIPLIVWSLVGDGANEADGPPVATEVANAARVDAPERGAAAEQAAFSQRARIEAPDPVAVVAATPLRVVDLAGRPLGGVRMRVESTGAVHWQGGDRGWINGGGEGMRLDADTESRVRTDATFAEPFFARFDDPREWRATVLDEALPEREATSADDGSFAFAPDVEVVDARLAVVGKEHVLVGRGARGTSPWIAGPRAVVAGVVRDTSGAPIGRARVQALVARDGGLVAVEAQPETNSDASGAFLLRFAVAGGVVRVRREGYETAVLAIERAGEQSLDVVLRPRVASARFSVDGVVVDESGKPVDGAAVWFGSESTKTAADGRFAFAIDEPKERYAVTVAKQGYALLQRDEFGRELLADAARGRDLVLMLRDRPKEIRGFVLGVDGRPLPSALVGLLDPTLLDISFTGVESRIGGFEGGVVSDAEGAFVIGGLAARSYRLACVDPRTGAQTWSAPIEAGSDGVVLRLPTDGRTDVRVRVQKQGRPVSDARLEVQFVTHVTKGGGTQFDGIGEVHADRDGVAMLSHLPRRGAWLSVRAEGDTHAVVPVEAIDDAGGECVVDLGAQRWLQLVAGAQRAPRTVSLELANGNFVAAKKGGAAAPTTIAIDGACEPIRLPDEAIAVVLDRGRPTETRLELTEDRAVILRVR